MGSQAPYLNGSIKEDVHIIKEDVHSLKQTINGLSNAITALAQEVNNHSENMKAMISMWQQSVPMKLVVMLIVIQAVAILGIEASRALIKYIL